MSQKISKVNTPNGCFTPCAALNGPMKSANVNDPLEVNEGFSSNTTVTSSSHLSPVMPVNTSHFVAHCVGWTFLDSYMCTHVFTVSFTVLLADDVTIFSNDTDMVSFLVTVMHLCFYSLTLERVACYNKYRHVTLA